MPNYRYVCQDCNKRFEVFMTYDEYSRSAVTCPQCSSQNVQRRIERIRFARSEESHLDDLADPNMLEGLEDDPRSLGKMMRKMSREVGEDLGPELNEVIDRLESGQNPEDIEAAMPDLAENLGEGPGGGMGSFGDDE